MKTIEELLRNQRELNAKMAQAKPEEMEALEREYNANKREIETLNFQLMAEKNGKTRENKGLVMQLREAINNGERSITVQGYTPTGGTAVAGVHDHAVSEDMQGILEPLYAKSVLSELGVRFYPGLPQGDIKIPKMTKNTVGWESEIGEASETGNTFSSIILKPKRLTAYVDISKQLIMQDTVGAEAAIKRDLVNALRDKLEATLFGDLAGDTTKPAGIFYGKTLAAKTTFAALCDLESTVEDANVYGNLKYLLSPKAKADLRAMAKSSKTTSLVFENGTVDGVPAVVTGNVNPALGTGNDAHGAAASFAYGDFSNIAVGSWGEVEIGIYDDSRTAVNGTVRLVINAYFDAAVLRSEAFAFGKTRS